MMSSIHIRYPKKNAKASAYVEIYPLSVQSSLAICRCGANGWLSCKLELHRTSSWLGYVQKNDLESWKQQQQLEIQ